MIDKARSSAVEPQVRASDVPWGLPVAVGAFVATMVVELAGVFMLAIGLDVSGNASFYNQHRLAFELVAYQFLVLGVLLSAFALLRSRMQGDWELLGFRFPGWRRLLASAAVYPVVVIGIAILTVVFNALAPGYLHGNTSDLLPASERHMALGLKLVILVWFAIEAPLTEETLFRGIIFQGVRQFFQRWLPLPWAVFTGAVVSGLTFGLVHGEPHTLPILAFFGIVLAYIFHFTRSLYASALVHGINNGLAVALVLFAP